MCVGNEYRGKVRGENMGYDLLRLTPSARKICSRNWDPCDGRHVIPGVTAPEIRRALCPVNGKGDERERT